MRVRSLFSHDFLLIMAGPVVWAAHFVLIYGLVGWLCARPGLATTWLGLPVSTWAVLLPGLAAGAAMAACARVRPGTEDAGNGRFIRHISLGLIGLALLAIAWETLSVVFIPSCHVT